MATHVKVIGILHVVMGAFGLLVAVGILALFFGLAGLASVSAEARDAWVAIPILGSIGAFVFTIVAVLSLPSVIAGVGLLMFKPWARILTIVLSVLHLFNVPFGTALGIYGLWALLSPETELLFQRGRGMAPMPQRY